MKNAVMYYYNLVIDSFTSSNSNYYIRSGNDYFMLYKTFRSSKEITDIYNLFNSFRNIYEVDNKVVHFFHKIVLNKDYSVYSIIDGNYYVLLKLSNLNNDKISIYDIKNVISGNINSEALKKFGSLFRFNWEEMWKEKLDYIEYQIGHLDSSYEELLSVLHYFIGIGENAVYYMHKIFNTLAINNANLTSRLSICHKRLCSDTKMIDFFNPFNIVIDHVSRDVAEYLKSSFINDDYDFIAIEEFFDELDFSAIDYNLLFARMLFPSFFLDLYIDSINLNRLEILLSIKNRCMEYQLFLKNIYEIISKKVNLFKVYWLVK